MLPDAWGVAPTGWADARCPDGAVGDCQGQDSPSVLLTLGPAQCPSNAPPTGQNPAIPGAALPASVPTAQTR